MAWDGIEFPSVDRWKNRKVPTKIPTKRKVSPFCCVFTAAQQAPWSTPARARLWQLCRPLCSHLRTASSHQRQQPLQRSGTRRPRPAGIARFRQGSPRFCMVSALCCQGAKAPIQHRRHQKHGDLKIVQTLRTKPAHSLLRTRQRCLPGNINNRQGAAENSGFVRLRPPRPATP